MAHVKLSPHFHFILRAQKRPNLQMLFRPLVVLFVTLAMALIHANECAFSLEEQAIWIDRLNYFRSSGLPWSAGNMRRIGWSPALATSAATTAATCSATTAPGVNVYESASTSLLSLLDEAIQQWVIETSMTTLQTLTQPGASDVEIGKGTYNAYSQILWASTTSVGCASASCSGGKMVVCEFSPVGNDGSSAWYVHAATASECPSGTTGSQGLCIVKGDSANDQIAPIPAGKLTYEVYPAYVANMQTVLIETARGIANGDTQTVAEVPTTMKIAATATSTPATDVPTSTKLSSFTDDVVVEANATDITLQSPMTPDYSSFSKMASSPSAKPGSTSTLDSTKNGHIRTSSPGTDTSSKLSTNIETQTTTPLLDDDVEPGTVKASLDTGSSFMNDNSLTKQTSSGIDSNSSSDTNDTPSTPSSDTGTASSISNRSRATGSDISSIGIAGILMVALVVIALICTVVSYRKNQQRQREIMRDGGIRVI